MEEQRHDWKKAETHLVVDKEGDVGPRRGSCVEFPVRNKKTRLVPNGGVLGIGGAKNKNEISF